MNVTNTADFDEFMKKYSEEFKILLSAPSAAISNNDLISFWNPLDLKQRGEKAGGFSPKPTSPMMI
jgi:predicted flavoprotein YhiN